MRERGNELGKRIVGIVAICACVIMGGSNNAGARQDYEHEFPSGQCALTGTGAESLTPLPNHAPSIGNVKALTLFIDFPDVRDTAGVQVRHDEFFPQTQNWYKSASFGKMVYENNPVLRYFTMPQSFRSYGVARGSAEATYARLIRDLISVADKDVNFAGYDIYNVIATPNAGAEQNTVLSVTWQMEPFVTADGPAFRNTSFVYNHQDVDGNTANRYRVLVHENGHTLGLPDLYPYADEPDQVGHWDVMSSDWGANNDMLAWHKWKLGWLENTQVDCVTSPGATNHSLVPVARPGGSKIAVVKVSDSRAMTVEARDLSGNDEGQCGQGVLISWVDTTVASGSRPISVHNANPGSSLKCDKPSMSWENNRRFVEAPLKVGQSFQAPESGAVVEVSAQNSDGSYQVKITRS
ncbi:MAG: M6 family metalloprotease domain-containing protein [Corynebacteriales bacterium]|nr:M6 family metalloprotease domain-containing protein [Mycobacteriales bacterium]